jgi:exonuclease III
MSDMKIDSWNIKGIGNPIKRKKMLSILKKNKVDGAFLQETHLSDTEHAKLKMDWVDQVYFSSYKSNSRGTAILINKAIPFNLGKNDYRPKWTVCPGFRLHLGNTHYFFER